MSHILAGQPVPRSGDTLVIGVGEPAHEVDTTVPDEEWKQLQKAIPEKQSEMASISAARNFHITDDNLGAGGAKAKYGYNIAAIRILKTIEGENRSATPEEQNTLSRYIGWGGIPQAFDPDNAAWSKEYAELKGLLTEKEYEMARASTLNAHYTSPVVIKAIYEAVGNMGFRTGNILEPSCGVGNFFGLLPDEMLSSHLYGVELDSISGRIAKQLYPNADITVAGFETTDRRDFFDLAIGNVPFGNYRVPDKAYDKLGFPIHDYFFAKALDQVRPGGIVAFITSRYTMDKQDPDVRRYIAQRAELLGAIRLPNDAFKANAGTEVTSDIIFLQKRDHPASAEPEWVNLGNTPDGIAINSYFAKNPDMMLGTMTTESTQYGHDATCKPLPHGDLTQLLHAALSNIARPDDRIFDIIEQLEESAAPLPADPNVRNYSYTVVDNEIYFRENSIMEPVEVSAAAADRIREMIPLRDCVRDLIQTELHGGSDDEVLAGQSRLNSLYDSFAKKYGLLNNLANRHAFEPDSSYSLLCSLENLDDNGNLERKADIFTKRTIRPQKGITSVETPVEALAVSIGEKAGVDLSYMASLLGGGDKKVGQIINDLNGVIFRNPEAATDDPLSGWEAADEYLSGNVRHKLFAAKAAKTHNPSYAVNVEALTLVQPKDLTASEIDVRLGATWVSPDIYRQFAFELLNTPNYNKENIKVLYSRATGVWNITGKSLDFSSVPVHITYGTNRMNAYYILENSLNLKQVQIFDTVTDANGKESRVLNAKETAIAQQKQEAVKQAFQEWIWKDPQRRERLCNKYNEEFNSIRPREYDGSHIRFVGMNPEIVLRPHQRNAVARTLYGQNTLLAHCVGAGKTFEMTASAMEGKRLGLCHKSLFVVPNHLTEQWGSDILQLYPGANILVATKRDFEPDRRKKFCARIATGDYDAVVIGHSQFQKIPVSKERQQNMIREQIDEIEEGIDQAKSEDGENFTIKQMEKTRKGLEARLEKLQDSSRKDDVVTFEELGIDRLYVDEADSFKNLFLYTKMRNVAGVGQTEALKSSDMYMKCRYMDEITGGRGITFATGTPISNSMTELYTMMRYLQYNMLQEHDLGYFDSWASSFGETVTATELAPEGTGFRTKTRFARFFNLPELMNMWKEAADIQTADMLHLPVPEVKYINVVTKASDIQKEEVLALADRAEDVRARCVEPWQDNMLKITNDGRMLALDQRLKDPMFPDDPDSKVNACVKNVFHIWEETESVHGTQLIFCDLSTPHYDGTFNIYDDMRNKLLSLGIPAEEIAFVHDAKTDVQKDELFSKVRSGLVRVFLGSTAKMGAGTNVQNHLIAEHHLDCPWKPRDIEQREGRIVRQGNRNAEVSIFRYVTEGTFDSYCWQLIENKQKFISQIMTSRSPARSCEDIDESVLSYAEVKALATGDPRIKEKMDLDIQVQKLKMLKSGFLSQHFALEDELLKHIPQEMKQEEDYIDNLQADQKWLAEHPISTDTFSIKVCGETYTDKKTAGMALIESRKKLSDLNNTLDIGEYHGFALQVRYDHFSSYQLILHRQTGYTVELGDDPLGNVTRINNVLGSLPAKLEKARGQLDILHKQAADAKAELQKTFQQETELSEKSARLDKLTLELSADQSAGKANQPDSDKLSESAQTIEDENLVMEENM